MSVKKVTIVLICCLLVVLATAVCALLDLYPDASLTAYAEDRPSFVIATADGEDWTLSQNGENVDGAECSGRFIVVNNPNCVAMKMYQSIQKCLRESGADVPPTGDFTVADYCNISFRLPDIHATVAENKAKYASQGILFEASVSEVISTPTFSFEYKAKDGEWKSAVAQKASGVDGYYFGIGIDSGEYEVRLVATEVIRYEVNDDQVPFEYSSKRYSETFDCTVEKAEIPTPNSVQKDVIYGQSVADIANSIRLADLTTLDLPGRFVPSEYQTDTALTAVEDKASVYLGVNDDGHVVYYDFVPDNQNYLNLTNVAVNVSVSPRSLYLRIHDAFSLVGEDIVEPTFQVLTALVGDDTVESLGASFVYQVDKNSPSMSYRTYVEFSNPNYTPDCHSYENQFADYGRYFVYATRIRVVADDGQEFFILIAEGIADVDITATRVDVDGVWNRKVVCAYEFKFVDKYGVDVMPEVFTVSWQNVPDDVGFVAVQGREDVFDVGAYGVTLSKEYNVICFLEKEVKPNALTPANIALIACCSALACATVALVVAWKKQRRYLV